jgi:hypothetical protein
MKPNLLIISMCSMLFLAVSVMSCAKPLFPPSAVKDLDPAMQMGIANPEADIYFKDHLAKAGGVLAQQRSLQHVCSRMKQLM